MAQRGLTPAEGASSLGMAGASISNQDVTAMYNNQAAIAFIDSTEIHVQANRKFNLNELSAVTIAAVTPTKFGHVGLMLSSYGFEVLSEQKLGLAYARKLTDNFSLGLQMDLIQFKIDEFGSTNTATFEAGVYGVVTKELHISAHVFSPANSSVTEDYALDSRMRLGIKYLPSDKVTLQLEMDKTLDLDWSLKMGIEYKLGKLYLRTGVSTYPGTFSFGFGYEASSRLLINAAYSYHQEIASLGYTPGIGLRWKL